MKWIQRTMKVVVWFFACGVVVPDMAFSRPPRGYAQAPMPGYYGAYPHAPAGYPVYPGQSPYGVRPAVTGQPPYATPQRQRVRQKKKAYRSKKRRVRSGAYKQARGRYPMAQQRRRVPARGYGRPVYRDHSTQVVVVPVVVPSQQGNAGGFNDPASQEQGYGLPGHNLNLGLSNLFSFEEINLEYNMRLSRSSAFGLRYLSQEELAASKTDPDSGTVNFSAFYVSYLWFFDKAFSGFYLQPALGLNVVEPDEETGKDGAYGAEILMGYRYAFESRISLGAGMIGRWNLMPRESFEFVIDAGYAFDM